MCYTSLVYIFRSVLVVVKAHLAFGTYVLYKIKGLHTDYSKLICIELDGRHALCMMMNKIEHKHKHIHMINISMNIT